MSFLQVVHQNVLPAAGIAMSLIIGVWGLFSFFRKQPATGGYRSSLVMTEFLFIAQGLFGAILFLAGNKRPHDGLHLLYGVLLVIALPIGASYVSGQKPRREPLVYGLVGLFMVGLTIRGITTGAP